MGNRRPIINNLYRIAATQCTAGGMYFGIADSRQEARDDKQMCGKQ